MDCFHGNSHKLCIFCFRKVANSKRAWPECHMINHLLPYLAQALLGNIGPHCARSVPRANIPQYGPRTRLVRG